MDCGGQCVMLDGVAMKPEWYADSWDTVPTQVELTVICSLRLPIIAIMIFSG